MVPRRKLSALVSGFLIVIGLLGPLSWARAPESWVEPTFGFELTFDSRRTDDRDKKERLIKKIVESAPKFARRRNLPDVMSRYERFIFFPGNSYIKFATDPGVIELTGTPQTVAGYETYRRYYDTLTFDLLAHHRLFPHEILGGGHVHVGSVWERDPQLLRDFTVDFYNHPSLAIGIFSYNLRQGLPMAEHAMTEQLEYLKTIQAFDGSGTRMSAFEFAEKISSIRSDRRTALNLNNLTDAELMKTVELRIAPQRSFQDFLLIIRLLRARIFWLKRHSHQPAAVPAGPRSFNEAQAEFRRYVEECGLGWRDYAHFGIATWKAEPNRVMRQFPMDDVGYELFAKEVAQLKAKTSGESYLFRSCEAALAD